MLENAQTLTSRLLACQRDPLWERVAVGNAALRYGRKPFSRHRDHFDPRLRFVPGYVTWQVEGFDEDIPFGERFIRRQKARLGPAQAAVATAHLMARVVYKILKNRVEYEPLSVAQYEQHYREQQLKYLHKKAAKFGFQLTPI